MIIPEDFGLTTLHHAVLKQDSERLENEIKKGHDVNAGDVLVWRPLHYAVQFSLAGLVYELRLQIKTTSILAPHFGGHHCTTLAIADHRMSRALTL
ncbi:hypothetical protein LY76DRAFT_597021 [Colletotrichum caudatum]|nr:hypothetical protein LY76DRAFT_597021 [Colletotrichum caudatum]